jgi:hypothetical protein
MPIRLMSADPHMSFRPNLQSKRTSTSARPKGHGVVPIIACPSVLPTDISSQTSPYILRSQPIKDRIITLEGEV